MTQYLTPKKAIVVLSGGMDSAAALGLTLVEGYNVIGALHFQYGSKHNAREYIAFMKVARHYKVPEYLITLPFIGQHFKSDLLKSGGEIPEGHYEDESMKRTVVPFRNGIMLAIAAGFAESVGAKMVVLGNHFGDHAIYPDCREDFAKAMRKAIALGTYAGIELHCPFQEMGKNDIALIGNSIEVPFHLTWTCYKGGENHCGKCGSCTERKEAFKLSGVTDPTVYEE